jgi:hypothetical protein
MARLSTRLREFDGKQTLVPTGVQRDLIIAQHIGPGLLCASMAGDHHRDFRIEGMEPRSNLLHLQRGLPLKAQRLAAGP